MKIIGIVLFNHYETLDVAGPIEIFGSLPDQFRIVLIAEKLGLVTSYQGQSLAVDVDFNSAPAIDILLVPGGMGTREEVHNEILLTFIRERSQQVELILSVCTGAALLAKAGVLD